MGEKTFQPRNTAVKCRISDLGTGRFVKGEGFESSFIDSIRGPISRVNIIAVIISINEDSITIDDGSERIRLVGFDNNYLFQNKEIGDIVMVIGKPRMYNNGLYIYPEIIKKVDKKWVDFRKKELEAFADEKIESLNFSKDKKIENIEDKKHFEKSDQELAKNKFEENKSQTAPSSYEEIIDIVKRLDKGNGADITDITKESDDTNIEEKIQKLINTGELFEIRRGRIKVLE